MRAPLRKGNSTWEDCVRLKEQSKKTHKGRSVAKYDHEGVVWNEKT